MSDGLTLPQDATAFVKDHDDPLETVNGPGVYALLLQRPENVTEEWDRHNDERPPWFDGFRDAEGVIYVGGSMSLLDRLTDHNEGEVRLTALTKVCDIQGLLKIWPSDASDWSELETEEWQRAQAVARDFPNYYVRQQ